MSKLRAQTSPSSKAIRSQYEAHGAREFYEKFGDGYRNPHEPIIRELLAACALQWNFAPSEMPVLDLACGSGEATLALRVLGFTRIDGIDPFTSKAYLARTQQTAEAFSFANIAAGVLQSRRYELCVCSFAMHLAPLSILPQLCLQLSLCCAHLLILTPNKRPFIRADWGWNERGEILKDRVRARFYESLNFS